MWTLPRCANTLHKPTANAKETAGIVEWGNFFEDHMLVPFNGLVNDLIVSPGTFLAYVALTRQAAVYWDTMPREPEISVLLQTLLTHGAERKAITNIYKALHMEDKCPFASLHTYWEEALQGELKDAQWGQALTVPKMISLNSCYEYIQFNYLHHTYLAPARLARIYSSAVDRCPRYHSGNADFPHMVWDCP
ncbi:hypothetical protein NDU88_001232 [Pleurodeles waltl]|uniref:Uncharacterized protein n=1 Tax=Pleurodeles waltl TaxID=8319 RepID=A0AAV7VYK2_PLEWA|nr:hypothetical protein NDU88_001232 [Pleurodeles waltl]